MSEKRALCPTDPLLILAGIKHFGLAADGSDLRDLSAAIDRLTSNVDNFSHGMTAANDRLAAVLAEKEKLRIQLVAAKDALAPFAAFAAWVKLKHPGWDHDDFSFASEAMPKFKAWRDAHKAFTALSDEKGGQ